MPPPKDRHMLEQRSPRRRLLAGLLAGAALATAGPFVAAVADHSGSEPWDPVHHEDAAEVRRGAEARWVIHIDEDRYYDYRVWVWQAAYVEVEAGMSHQATEHGWKGEAVAARRVCWGYEQCSGFSYWRGPAGAATAPAAQGNMFWMEPVTGQAHFEGTLMRAGDACDVVMDWEPTDITDTNMNPPSSQHDPDAAVWRSRSQTNVSASCWDAIPATAESKVWVNTGL